MANYQRSDNDVAQLIERADIVDIAKKIGLQVDNRRREPTRAICPFHNDKDPSLTLYRAGKLDNQRSHYHCFVCGAHGDVLKLIRDYERLSFPQAVVRLADLLGIKLERGAVGNQQRQHGGALISELIQAASPTQVQFSGYARSRGYDPHWLHNAGAAIINLQPVLSDANTDRVVEEELIAAGIARPRDTSTENPDLWPAGLRGFYSKTRLLFQINSIRGVVAGFAARALGEEKPKYLYSYGFSRKSTLYRADAVIARLRNESASKKMAAVDLYIVEGLFDALRLESLGLCAVSVLGSQITPEQMIVLQSIMTAVAQDNRTLNVHVFFDSDAAGKKGAYDATIAILKLLETSEPFSLDVLWPTDGVDGKVDPDSALLGKGENEAGALLQRMKVSPIAFLASFWLDENPHKIPLQAIPKLKLASVARRIARALSETDWGKIQATLDSPSDLAPELASFASLVGLYTKVSGTAQQPQVNPLVRGPSDELSDLLTALTLGRSSTSRREYPLDDASWDRLNVAASTFFHFHSARLEIGDGPSSPYLAKGIPKGNEKYRLKKGPVAEDALLQQYVLIELLRDRLDCPDFSRNIPAVRYAGDNEAGRTLYCTTQGRELEEVVSFAYQIDMSIVNGEMPPRREGIFRPYFECWRSFIDFVETKIKKFYYDEVQILRLDITGFYDNIRRETVQDALAKPLADALGTLTASIGDVGAFAPLLMKDAQQSPEHRAEGITEFVLRHTFGVSYFDPVTGKLIQCDHGSGIPQGPDLSAYLANISLFELDAMMVHEVALINSKLPDRSKNGAAYARYVDDIVLVCRDIETASQLRRKVESFLARHKLNLNRKNATPPPMTRAQARAWITDNRAGFGFSGPLSDLPSTDAMDPLAEAGEIDRKTALGLIFDPELDNPDNVDRALERISTSLKAPDLRFSDQASAFRRLWIYAAHDDACRDGAALTREFIKLFERVGGASFISLGRGSRRDMALACLEGLDRALRSTVPAGTLAPAACVEVDRRISRIAQAILSDAFTPLVTVLMAEDPAGEVLNRFDVRTQIAIMARLAAQKCCASQQINFAALARHLEPAGEREAIYSGLRWSLHNYDPTIQGERPSLVITREDASEVAFTRLHAAIVQLQRLGRDGGIANELTGVTAPEVAEPNQLVRLTVAVLKLWGQSTGASDQGGVPEQIELDAAAALVNLTYMRFAEVANRRPRLVELIAGEVDVKALPSPPGLKASGILLWCTGNRLLLAKPQDHDEDPTGIAWTLQPNTLLSGVTLKRAELPEGCVPLVMEDRSWSPKDIASTYRKFFPIWAELNDREDHQMPVPTVFSFFAGLGEGGALLEPRMVMWIAPREAVDGHAFVRSGDALEARSVFAEGADIWRFGWSVRDLCGRLELPSDEDGGLEAHAGVSLEREMHRREAIITRVLPRLSGTDRFGPGKAKRTDVPSRVDRGLKLLESFGSTSIAADVTYLVAAVAEGIFMGESINARGKLGTPGLPGALAANAAKRAMRALPEAARLWAPLTIGDTPYRRSSAAWFAIAEVLRGQLPGLSPIATAPIKAFALGVEMLGVGADLRALAFELAGGLDGSAIQNLRQSNLDDSWLREMVGLDLLLVEDERSSDCSTEAQTQKLIATFTDIVLSGSTGLQILRDRITPAGWAVLVATLMQVVSIEQPIDQLRPSLWRMNASQLELARESLSKLLNYVSTVSAGNDDGDGWPWIAFNELENQRPDRLAKLLRQATDASALSVVTETSSINPRSDEGGPGKIGVITNEEKAAISDWQADIAYIRGEKGSGTEMVAVAGRNRYVYSISKFGDRLLGLHLVSRQLAGVLRSPPVSDPSSPGRRPELEPSVENLDKPSENRDAEPVSYSEARGVRPVAHIDNDQAATEQLAVLRAIQRSGWQIRASEKVLGMQRVALVQWDVAETYFSPSHNIGKAEGLLRDDGTPVSATDIAAGGTYISTTEFRRRAILKSVLAACLDFGVDGIVLPEYSMRPETINWLARQLTQVPSPVTIWCGTFRIPGGTRLDYNFGGNSTDVFLNADLDSAPAGRARYDGHTALLTYLRASKDSLGKLIHSSDTRRKRYPSTASGELIRPPIDDPWRPLLSQVTDAFDIGAFAIELVCSEMFPHASSANFVGIIEENAQLASRYSLGGSAETPFEYLTRDMYEFAKWTSYRNLASIKGDVGKQLLRGKVLQRTLVILPAMTTRSADYHVFGQNQYLAAGLVTVFCNAYEPDYGCGQSCFIGLDGWRDAEPPPTPYGEVAPGIFQLGGKHSGPLGKQEAAIVIADLDLMRTTDQKPKPHYQGRALKLVAHLPLIFATQRGSNTGSGAYPAGSRSERLKNVGGSDAAVSFELIAPKICEALKQEAIWRTFSGPLHFGHTPTAAYSKSVSSIAEALSYLESFADDSMWLTKRREAFLSGRYEHPSTKPLPALIDWVYVDDRWKAPSSKFEKDEVENSLTDDRPLLSVPSACFEPERNEKVV